MASTGTPKVNKPIDPKQKEADVNRKLQFYGIATAFQNGKVPSNEQIDVALNSFLASRALSRPSKNLSSEGRVLVSDVQEVVNAAKTLVLSKNEGNLLQDFIYQTTQFDPKAVSTPDAPVSKETAKQHGDKALEGLRTLGTLIITNGQFRKLRKCLPRIEPMKTSKTNPCHSEGLRLPPPRCRWRCGHQRCRQG